MGDYVRWAPPYYGDDEQQALGTRSALYLSLNRNKRSIRLDLKSDGGREALLRLVDDFDVVLEGFRPGVLDRLGVGYERMREAEPGARLLRDHRLRADRAERPARRPRHELPRPDRPARPHRRARRPADPVGRPDRRPRRRRADGGVRDHGRAARGAALGRGPARRRLDGRRGALLAGDGRRRLPLRRRGAAARRRPADRALRLLPALRGRRRLHHDGRARAAVLGPLLRRRRARGPGRQAVRARPARRRGARSPRSSARRPAPSGRPSTTSTTR